MAWKGKVANILQEVDLPLISDATCAKTNNERYFKPVRTFQNTSSILIVWTAGYPSTLDQVRNYDRNLNSFLGCDVLRRLA